MLMSKFLSLSACSISVSMCDVSTPLPTEPKRASLILSIALPSDSMRDVLTSISR